MVLLMTAIWPSFGLVSLLFVAIQAAGWVQNIDPLVYYHYGELETTYRFLGNESHKDHFKLLEKDQNSLLVGARNIVYNISLKDLTEFTDQVWRIIMHSPSNEVEELVTARVENFEKVNEENLHLKNKTLYKYNCDVCGKKFHFRSNYEKHKKQYLVKHKCCKSYNKVENVENSHKCKRMPLKSNTLKKNQIKIVQNADKREKEYIDLGNVEDGDETGSVNHNDDIIEDDDDDDDDDNEFLDENHEKTKKPCRKKFPQDENSDQKIYKCEHCLQLFTKYVSLSQHLKSTHNKQGRFKCQICDEDFSTNQDFELHMSLHGPEDKIICKGCRKTFRTLKLYYTHARQNPGMHCFICKLCFRKFPTELMLEQHVCICQNGKPLHCACGREFTRYQDVINHSKGTKPFSCCSCPHLANSLTAYIRHLRKHSKQKPYHCTKCDMKFAVIDFLNIHNKKFHNEIENESSKESKPDVTEDKQHTCNLCQETFSAAEELKKHNDEVHEQQDVPEERVQCPDCGKLLKRNRLENHRNTHKTSASLCPECGKLFDTRFKLTQHVITAHNSEPVKCEVCMKVLKTKKILNEHMKTHLKSELGGRVPQAICPMCGLGLAQKGSLARHILLTHEKHKIVPCNKTYTCQECSEVLPNRAKYYSHRRMHRAMVDRFPCEVCGRQFNKKQNLKRHMYLLHDETRVLSDPIFKCQFCTRCFREKKNLKRHYKMVHKVEDIA